MGNVRLSEGNRRRPPSTSTRHRAPARSAELLFRLRRRRGHDGTSRRRPVGVVEGLDRDPGRGPDGRRPLYLFSLGDFGARPILVDRAAQLPQGGSLPRFFREFTTLVVRREDADALLAILRDIPAGRVFSGLGARIFARRRLVPAIAPASRRSIKTSRRSCSRTSRSLTSTITHPPATSLGSCSAPASSAVQNGCRGRARDPPRSRTTIVAAAGVGAVPVEVEAWRSRHTAEALAALRRAVDGGWRWEWWQVETDPTLASIRAEPAFVAIIDEVKADVARQLMRVRELERNGTIPAPLPIAATGAAAPAPNRLFRCGRLAARPRQRRASSSWRSMRRNSTALVSLWMPM